MLKQRFADVEAERDELYDRFVRTIYDVQQKSGFKNLVLEKKLAALSETLEKKVRSSQEGQWVVNGETKTGQRAARRRNRSVQSIPVWCSSWWCASGNSQCLSDLGRPRCLCVIDSPFLHSADSAATQTLPGGTTQRGLAGVEP